MPYIASKVVQTTGIPLDQIRLILSQVYAAILCYGLYNIKEVRMRKYYSLLFGTLLQLYVYKDSYYQYVWLMAETVMVYWVCKNYTRTCGKLVTWGSVLLLSMFHIYRLIVDYGGWAIDISTVMMVMVCKFSLFAYQCQDGTNTGEKLDKMTEEQKTQRLVNIPSFYDYVCYLQFLPSSVMGPSLDYTSYSTFINLENQYQNIPDTKAAAFKSFYQSLSCLFLYQFVYQVFFPVQFMTTERFLKMGWWAMVLYSWISVTLIRFKYYFAWKINSCGIHACGISYSKTQTNSEGRRQALFTLHPNAHVLKVQGSVHVREKIANWNIPVQNWLRRCVYERVKSNGQFITFMVSAFWHGFYGGYYLSFFLWFAMVFLSQLIFRINRNNPIISKTFAKTGIIGQILLWLFVNITFSNHGSYFQILSAKAGWRMMVANNFIPTILILVPTIILQFSGLASKKEGKGKLLQKTPSTPETKVE